MPSPPLPRLISAKFPFSPFFLPPSSLSLLGLRFLSQIMTRNIPFEVDIAGQIFQCFFVFTLLQVALNDQLEHLIWTGSGQEIWRRRSAVAAGYLVATATRGRSRHDNLTNLNFPVLPS